MQLKLVKTIFFFFSFLYTSLVFTTEKVQEEMYLRECRVAEELVQELFSHWGETGKVRL